jgi:hypothetical protein
VSERSLLSRSSLSTSLLISLALLSGCERKASPSVERSPAVAAASAVAQPSPVVGTSPPASPAARASEKVEFPEVPIRAGAVTNVFVAWKSPEGTGVNEAAPFRVRWNRSDALAEAPADVKATGTSARDGFHIEVRPLEGAPNATLGGVIELVVCDVATHAVCLPVRRSVEIEFVVAQAAKAETTVTVQLPQARAL